ncbi:MAG TPA: PEPxxWA-CTERM sorting domain-containing protein [Phenylobacterium sp.]|jgi:hypothetical protein
MNYKLWAVSAAAVVALGLAASPAAAGILSITPLTGDAIPLGETLITDFNSTGGEANPHGKGGAINDLASGFHFSQGSGAYTADGFYGLESGVSAPPPLDDQDYFSVPLGAYYETVLGGGSATLTSDKGLKQFSFYMGSPDSYNHLKFTFYGVHGGVSTLDGTAIWGGSPAGNGDQSFGTTVVYKFGPEAVKKITFSSDTNSFEFDKLGGIAVPEPATWGMMVLGFGMAGTLMRGRRRALA